MGNLPSKMVSGEPPSAGWLSGRIATLLSHYFDPRHGGSLTEAAATDWLDLLGGYPKDAIQHACGKYMRTQTSKRPTPADIVILCQEWMKHEADKQRLADMPPMFGREYVSEGPRVTPERAQEILAEYGFTQETFAAVARFPKSMSVDEALERNSRGRVNKLYPHEYMSDDEMKQAGLM